jgi:hypothetical protein
MLDGFTAGERNALAIFHQTMGNALAIRDELPAIDLSVAHAGVSVLLIIRPRRQRREYDPTQTKQSENTDLHRYNQPPELRSTPVPHTRVALGGGHGLIAARGGLARRRRVRIEMLQRFAARQRNSTAVRD